MLDVCKLENCSISDGDSRFNSHTLGITTKFSRPSTSLQLLGEKRQGAAAIDAGSATCLRAG